MYLKYKIQKYNFMYFVFYKILYKIHVQNFAIAKNFFQTTWFKHWHG